MQQYSRLHRTLALTGLLLALTVATAYARQSLPREGIPGLPQQTSTIAFANSSALQTTIVEGDDFANLVLADPWDMDAVRDIGYEIGFKDISVADGIWSGTYSGVDHAPGTPTYGYIFPLFQGFSTPISSFLSQELDFKRVGSRDRYAINSAKYTQLSYRMSVSPRSSTMNPHAVYWTSASPVTWPDGNQKIADLDACQGDNYYVAWNGWHLYNYDLTNPTTAVVAGSWQAQPLVRGLRIDPSAGGPTGSQVQIDWIRLSDPTSAPTITIPWTAANIPTPPNGDPNLKSRISIYVADNASGMNAMPLAYSLITTNSGSYNLPTSILPPGQYYFQLRMSSYNQQRGCEGAPIATSAWVGPLTILPAPSMQFAKPSMTSGPDYATEVLGNSWDMSQSGDVITPGADTSYPQTITDASFTNGIYSARAIILPPAVESDSQMWLNVDPNRPINSNRYRYFTVRLKVDMPPNKDLNWGIAYGWGGRIIWWNQGIQQDGSESKFGSYYDGWYNYSVDLARALPGPRSLSDPAQKNNILTPIEQNNFAAQLGWSQMGSVKYLRYDPLETTAEALLTGADIFFIDWVKLTANDEVRRGERFDIEAGVNLPLSAIDDIRFYYTSDRNQPTQHVAQRYGSGSSPGPVVPATNAVFLPMVTRGMQNEVVGNPLNFEWDTSTVSPGTYYICSQLEVASESFTYCSETPVVVLP